MYNLGQYSPTYGDGSNTMPGIEVIPEEEDVLRFEKARLANRKAGFKPMNVSFSFILLYLSDFLASRGSHVADS